MTFRTGVVRKVVVDEANLGRPIPQKVKDTIEEYGSAILSLPVTRKYLMRRGKKFGAQART
jgi:hypothetical protein